MTQALIAAGYIAAVSPEAFPVHPEFVWTDISAVSPPPQAGWTASCTGGVWSYAPPTAPPAPALAPAAKAALDASDITIIRCFEHGVAVPAEWIAYRAALRPIAAGTSTATELPAMPAYPSGT